MERKVDDVGPAFYHVCFTVPDLEAAMTELTDLVGVTWGEPIRSQFGDWPYSLAFSTVAPHFELISSVVGSPWHSEQPGFHHLGWWSHCLDETLAGWVDRGAEPLFDGRHHGRRFGYVDAPASGVRLEAVDIGQRKAFVQRWSDKPDSV